MSAGAGEAVIDGRLPALAPALRAVAARFGTPAYVIDIVALDAAAAHLAEAFPHPWQRRFSLKANDEPAVVERLAALGLGANVVSRGEWSIAHRAGLPNEAITLEGIGKTDADLDAAVRATADGAPLAWLAVESADELAALAGRAARAGLGTGGRPPLEILLRLNPDVAPETHAGLAVGAGGSKFGLTETELTELVERAADAPGLRPRGIQLHVGSQLGAVDAWRDAVRRALATLALVRGGHDAFDTLDVGGGFPAITAAGGVPTPARFARELPGLVESIPPDRRPRRWAVEPGRFLVAAAGWLLAGVLHVRARREPPLVVLDAGMTELVRPALYGAQHSIVALTSLGDAWDTVATQPPATSVPTRVDGPICESTDALGEHRLPALQRGDLVAIRDAGAYAASMAMSYNGRPRPPLVFVEVDASLTLGRRRGSLGRLRSR